MTKAGAGIRREEPPPERKTYDWTTIADQLRNDPGEWYLIYEQDRASLAHAIRNDAISAMQPVVRKSGPRERTDGFELRTVNNTRGNPRMCDLFMRYVPPKRRRKK